MQKRKGRCLCFRTFFLPPSQHELVDCLLRNILLRRTSRSFREMVTERNQVFLLHCTWDLTFSLESFFTASHADDDSSVTAESPTLTPASSTLSSEAEGDWGEDCTHKKLKCWCPEFPGVPWSVPTLTDSMLEGLWRRVTVRYSEEPKDKEQTSFWTWGHKADGMRGTPLGQAPTGILVAGRTAAPTAGIKRGLQKQQILQRRNQRLKAGSGPYPVISQHPTWSSVPQRETSSLK
ncbi:hypothetical protein CapIbe_010892 [Capra ibex]